MVEDTKNCNTDLIILKMENMVNRGHQTVSNIYLLLNGPVLVLYKFLVLKSKYNLYNIVFDFIYCLSFLGKLTKLWKDRELSNYANLWLLLLGSQIFNGNSNIGSD